MVTIKVHLNKKTGENYLKIQDFKGLVDIKSVKSYTFEPAPQDKESFILSFFDKAGNKVPFKKDSTKLTPKGAK